MPAHHFEKRALCEACGGSGRVQNPRWLEYEQLIAAGADHDGAVGYAFADLTSLDDISVERIREAEPEMVGCEACGGGGSASSVVVLGEARAELGQWG